MNKPLIGAFLAALLLGAGVAPAVAADPTTPPQFMVLPAITPLPLPRQNALVRTG
mgnify:CR=1 FL=1